jgi:hypothetical protein
VLTSWLGQLEVIINFKIPTALEFNFIGKVNYCCGPQSLKEANLANLRQVTSSENNSLQKLLTMDSIFPKAVLNEYSG